MHIGFGFAIVTVIAPLLLLKTFLQSKKIKDYERRLGIKWK